MSRDHKKQPTAETLDEYIAKQTARDDAEHFAAVKARQSPEITGAWRCATPGCGNRTEFVGIDARGYGGPDECEKPRDSFGYPSGPCPNRGAMPEDCCGCNTELVQPFSVFYAEDGSYTELDYERYEGGGDGSEIGSYTKIICADCGATLWKEE